MTIKTIQTKEQRDQLLDQIIVENDYEGIRDQDGWETLTLTVKSDYPNWCDALLVRLATHQFANPQAVDRATKPVVELDLSTKKVWIGYNPETDTAVKGLVENWGWAELNLIQVHFAIKGALNIIRTSIVEKGYDPEILSITEFSEFVLDSYDELLSAFMLNNDDEGYSMCKIVKECYLPELSEINDHIHELKRKSQNWAYLTKVTS
jgi:hypothetical protein